ncbi:TPA: hypothetical protein O1251_002000 [Staphylococcus aureus]|nr:hypothetical protein [Staphylococcus aureus]HCY6673389.1 hypothetical protein [Staphylococcus aureus]
MATISITTDYKFTKKSAQKLIDAMEINENNSNVNKTSIKATKIKSTCEIENLLKDYRSN